MRSFLTTTDSMYVLSSYTYFELLLKQVTQHTWKFLSVTLLFPACAWNKHSNIPQQSVRITPTLYLGLCNSSKSTWAMSTLKTGEVPEEVLPLVNVTVLMHSWAAASLKLQFFICILLLSFFLFIPLTDPNTLQAVDQFARFQWLA